MDIGTSFITISKTWPELKAIIVRDNLVLRSEVEGDIRHLFALDNPIIYLCTLYLTGVPYSVSVSQEDNDMHLSEYDTYYASSANSAITKRSAYGIQISESAIRAGSKTQVVSQNFCDNKTWYSTSSRISEDVLSDSGDGCKWHLPDGYATLVDLVHGRVLHERRISSTYKAVVQVDGYSKVEINPHDGIGDFYIDYSNGDVVFSESQAGKVVKMSYSKVNNSKWYLAPLPGKVLRLVSAELQFSVDCRLADSFIFQPRADVAKFPPLAPYCTVNGGPYPPGTMIPIGDPTCYQTVFDLICEANLAYPKIPKWQGNDVGTWRDLKSDILIFSWDYGSQASVDLRSDLGLDIEISLEHDVQCGGTAAVITFYCISEDI